jgi:AbrB family looped-hinge helix DNA binding protein
MVYSSTLSSRGQTVIPAPLRERLGLKTGDTITFFVEDDKFLRIAREPSPLERIERIRAAVKKSAPREMTDDEAVAVYLSRDDND